MICIKALRALHQQRTDGIAGEDESRGIRRGQVESKQ